MAEGQGRQQAQYNGELAEPFSRIFVDRPEADWAFDLLRESVRRLGPSIPYDPRFALTLPQRSGRLALHLSFGPWLVLGFRGPGQTAHRVDIALLAGQVEWDERLTGFTFDRKEGEPEVRTYHLPLETVRPLTSDLRAAYQATLDLIANKFHTWTRSTHWQQHKPEIIEALFDTEKRAQLFSGALAELRYERHFTAFSHELAEEEEIYDIESLSSDEGSQIALSLIQTHGDISENAIQGGRFMKLTSEKIDQLLSLVRQKYPEWSGFSDPGFIHDEISYKQETISKAQDLLDETELKRLISEHQFDEFIDRLDRIGKDNNLLWRSVPASGDLNILSDPKLDKPTFCEAVVDLLYGSDESPDRLDRYIHYIQDRQLPNKWTFPTYFLFICHPDTEMFVKPRTTRWFVEYVGGSGIYTTKPTGAAYRTIKAISEQLRGALQEYQSHDMVDIQSFIWVCRPEYQNTGDEEEVLARPFSQIFVDRTEAEWAFDFLRETLERLGVTRADDERFAITLPGKNILRLNFGVWAIVSFYELTHLPNRIHVDLITDGLNLEKHSYKQWGTFARNDDEPEISGFELPLEAIKTTSDDLLKTFEKTLDHIAVKFQNYTRCPWRSRHHVSQIAEAVFDPKKRNDLFSEGLTEEMLEIVQVDGADTVESLSLEEQINPLYPLPQLATDTGFAEAELARWVRAIERKKQAILYGPPGTGKTYLAEKLAEHLIGGEDGFRELVQFHPAYAYEDFIQGIRPRSEGDHLSYPLVPGRLLEFCRRAQARQGRCVLIIDEINRANLARVFGELMYLLEYRDREMPLAQGGTLRLPSNVRLIGTMNTADRSIALVDHALRRRFAFIALSPNYDVLRHYHERHQTGFSVDGLINVLKRLNTAIDDPHYAVGMTFFFHKDLQDQLEDIWRMEIEPYLEEYFFDQPSQVDEFRWAEIGPQVLP